MARINQGISQVNESIVDYTYREAREDVSTPLDQPISDVTSQLDAFANVSAKIASPTYFLVLTLLLTMEKDSQHRLVP